MSTTQKVVRNILSIKQDGLSWASGDNAITFPESFANVLYTRIALAPGRTITYTGSKLQTGFTVNSTGSTSEGYYEAEGESLAYRDTAVVGADLVQRIFMPLLEGDNTITFAESYADDMWVCAWPGFDANIVIGTKTAQSVVLNAPADVPGFSMIVSGKAA